MALLQGNQGATGKQIGQNLTAGFGEFSDLLVTELQPRFYQQAVRGNLYSGTFAVGSISNATFTVATASSGTLATAATATPIIGIWNPPSSGVNAILEQAILSTVVTALAVTGPGPYEWIGYSGQTTSLSTATTSLNRKLGLQPGQVKVLNGVALTGLQSVFTFIAASPIGIPMMNVTETQTAVGFMPSISPGVENLDGSIIVPPGGVIGLFATTTPVAISAAATLTWAEVSV